MKGCIKLWKTKTDNHNFYDNNIVIAYHIVRAFNGGITLFKELEDDIEQYITTNLSTFNFAELNLAYLTLDYFNKPALRPAIKRSIIGLISEDNFTFEPFKYFTSKDRNFYGGSSCPSAVWFLETINDW